MQQETWMKSISQLRKSSCANSRGVRGSWGTHRLSVLGWVSHIHNPQMWFCAQVNRLAELVWGFGARVWSPLSVSLPFSPTSPKAPFPGEDFPFLPPAFPALRLGCLLQTLPSLPYFPADDL